MILINLLPQSARKKHKNFTPQFIQVIHKLKEDSNNKAATKKSGRLKRNKSSFVSEIKKNEERKIKKKILKKEFKFIELRQSLKEVKLIK